MRRELIAYEEPKSHVSELFRTLRTNVQFMNSNRKLRTLLITSTLPGEGKSWVSSNLAITFAQADKRVLLIDADMRKCSLHRVFRVESCPGLSNYLAGLNDSNDETVDFGKFIRETEVPNLYLLPSGNVPPNPSELLASPQMITLLDELKSEFDIIIIDGTPSKLVTDAVILSRLVDSTIIVTGHNMVKKDDLSKTIKDQELVFDKPQTEWEILVEFVDYITSNDLPTLLKENIDFTDKDKTKEIEQMEHLYKKDFRVNKRYIRKLFFKLYGKKKNLYTELEKFNPELFKKVKGYDGKPCFMIPKYS